MLLKIIRLGVLDAPAFDRAVGGIYGFAGQAGGWTNEIPARAIIVSAWNSRDDNHNETYADAEIALFETICEIPGEAGSLAPAMTQGGYLRLADCTIRAERTQHFRLVQESIWNPGMARAPGMLGGAFAVSYDDVLRYAVATFWSDEAAHRDYQEHIFPGLNALAGINDDAVRVAGYRIKLVPDWRVPSDPSPPARS